MPIKNIHQENLYTWSPSAKLLLLPDGIKFSIGRCLPQDEFVPNKDREIVLTINQAWHCTAAYALDNIRNSSRDSDRLAQRAANRVQLPIPSLDLLAEFPYGKVSSPSVERAIIVDLRQSCENFLSNMVETAEKQTQTPELQLIKMHDLNRLKQTQTLIDSLSRYPEAKISLLIESLSKSITSHQFPYNLQADSPERIKIWDSLSEASKLAPH